MIRFSHLVMLAAGAALLTCLAPRPARAVPFTTGYTDGGSWNTIYAQGFKASVAPSPDPGHGIDDTVFLDRFQFFKGGNADAAANFQLAIVNNFFVNLETLTMSSPELVGLSTNTIASTATIATGGAITFNFNHLPLVYGANNQDELANDNYAAVFVNRNGDTLTPVLVSALVVNYVGDELQSDYGIPGNYFHSVSNFIGPGNDGTGQFLKTFNMTPAGGFGDANFIATFDLPAGMQGDYNSDGAVNAADYVVWRESVGGPSIPNRGDGIEGNIGQQDYDFWRSHFGDSSSGASAGLSVTFAAPEPSALVLMALAGVALVGGRRRPPVRS